MRLVSLREIVAMMKPTAVSIVEGVVLAVIGGTILLVLVILISRSAAAQHVTDLRCEGDWCMVRRETMVLLVEQAAAASQFAALCGWVKPMEPETVPK